METDYKKQDRQLILEYLAGHPGPVSVRRIKEESGATPLRIHPLLFELEEEGLIEVTEREELGAAEMVRLKKNC